MKKGEQITIARDRIPLIKGERGKAGRQEGEKSVFLRGKERGRTPEKI